MPTVYCFKMLSLLSILSFLCKRPQTTVAVIVGVRNVAAAVAKSVSYDSSVSCVEDAATLVTMIVRCASILAAVSFVGLSLLSLWFCVCTVLVWWHRLKQQIHDMKVKSRMAVRRRYLAVQAAIIARVDPFMPFIESVLCVARMVALIARILVRVARVVAWFICVADRVMTIITMPEFWFCVLVLLQLQPIMFACLCTTFR